MGGVSGEAISAIALLNDPVRRALFDAVRGAPAALSREEAAKSVGISAKLAAFHLDKLLEARLLVVQDPAQGAGRRAGRVGRRPKLYRSSARNVEVSIPPRRTTLLAELLVDVIGHLRPAQDAMAAVLQVSHDRGREVGAEERPPRARKMGPERALTFLRGLLERLGYEVAHDSGALQFRACPFHPLSEDALSLVCGMHHAYVAGLIEGLDVTAVDAALIPGAGGCCVEVRERRTS